MNVLRIAVMEGDLQPVVLNSHFLSEKQQFELFVLACEENRLEAVKYLVENRGVLGFTNLVPGDEYFEDPDGFGYTGYVGLYKSTLRKNFSITSYLSELTPIYSKGDYPNALFMSVVNNDYASFSLLWSKGMRDFRDRALKESIRSCNYTFFKLLFPRDGYIYSDMYYLFNLAIASRNLDVSLFLHELDGELTPGHDSEFFDLFVQFKAITHRTRTRAANKIRFWWGPILRRINPEFTLKEAEKAYRLTFGL